MLVERLMGLNDDGSTPSNGYNLKIPVHAFFAACGEIISQTGGGTGLTVAQVKALVWQSGGSAMRTSPNDQAEFDAMISLAPIVANLAGRALYLDRIHGIFMLAEARISGYDTPAAVRTKIGI